MPSLDYTFLHQLRCNHLEYSTFVETGTHGGETIFSMEPYFNNLYTIELSKKYYESTKSKYQGNKITFVLGDSAVELENVIKKIHDDTIFFLDGHYSAGDTAQGQKDCPLVEEITAIAKYFSKKAVIVIDDYRLFSKGPKDGFGQDWTEINKDVLLGILNKRVTDVYFLPSICAPDDRLIIHINSI